MVSACSFGLLQLLTLCEDQNASATASAVWQHNGSAHHLISMLGIDSQPHCDLDSFVDFDLIGQVDPETYKVRKLSFYAELIWEARKARAKADGTTIDWVVLRNRTQYVEAHNMKRIISALGELSQRVGFRIIPGLSERVIYRELFPAGLTMLDKEHLGRLATSHIAARQELRELIKHLALPQPHSSRPSFGKPQLVA